MTQPDDILNAKILIVDDLPINVQLLEFMLGAQGYRAVSSTTEPRAVAALHARDDYDLIILDLHMPGMSGFDVMAALRPQEAGDYLPVLVVTADPDKKLAALQLGARDFISKPFDAPEVLTRIRNLLEVRLLHRAVRRYNVRLERTVRARSAQLQRFRRAMDASADAIFLIDCAGPSLVDVNDGACRLLGYERAQLLALVPAALVPRRAGAPAGGADDDPPGPGESALLRRDGTLVPVELNWQWQRGGGGRGADRGADSVSGAADRDSDGGADGGADGDADADADADGAPILIAVARDIRERRAAQRRLRQLASYDSLTGLPNRARFFQSLAEALARARGGARQLVLLLVALDRFKGVNDSFGAALGDDVLRQCGARLLACARGRDAAARLGGAEFALLLETPRGAADALAAADEVRNALRAPYPLRGRALALTASIGIALYPDNARDADTLVACAGAALARAKLNGRDGCRFFETGLDAQALARRALELALRDALERAEFELHYQPKADLRSGRVSGVEALLRWRRPGHGLLAPAAFMAALEDSGLIVPVGAWVLAEACRQIARWRDGAPGPLAVAVNLSGRQLAEGGLEQQVRGALAACRVAPALLELELTEAALMAGAAHAIAPLERLRQSGVRIAIDDFGSGYSSLANLRRFPVDRLKIDIAFVRDVTSNPDDAAIARAIIGMAHSLRLRVTAEGGETRGQLAYLRRHRCDEIQGFHFCRPLPAAELERALAAGIALPPPAPPERPDAPPRTLLIVDDDANVLASLQRLFRPDGHRVLSAATPAEGFELLALYEVQVVMCDQRMPVVSGTEFLSKVKELYPDTVRIILSGYTGLEAVLDSINRGAIYRFYTKPWDDEQLRDNIRLAFQHYWRQRGARDPAPA